MLEFFLNIVFEHLSAVKSFSSADIIIVIKLLLLSHQIGKLFTDRCLMLKNTIFVGKPEPLGIFAS